MNNKNINLKKLKVESFVTSLLEEKVETVKGGWNKYSIYPAGSGILGCSIVTTTNTIMVSQCVACPMATQVQPC